MAAVPQQLQDSARLLGVWSRIAKQLCSRTRQGRIHCCNLSQPYCASHCAHGLYITSDDVPRAHGDVMLTCLSAEVSREPAALRPLLYSLSPLSPSWEPPLEPLSVPGRASQRPPWSCCFVRTCQLHLRAATLAFQDTQLETCVTAERYPCTRDSFSPHHCLVSLLVWRLGGQMTPRMQTQQPSQSGALKCSFDYEQERLAPSLDPLEVEGGLLPMCSVLGARPGRAWDPEQGLAKAGCIDKHISVDEAMLTTQPPLTAGGDSLKTRRHDPSLMLPTPVSPH
ncbi:Terminal Nucleotidyltransferase 5C [Manis pentadactyla]|nr:Terminal Nucleotidyltransferase 5C [Manis pentadactyla]